ncbi:jg19245 [Pararge aegeria aegeria]|uniref:Jg19245 protein n=1 Tax=Pararge aegeria aegeria TaxID=348720 RepID=A0A8S4QKA1_9NEOP|nr:jg19245 [Pararge aegeria aegeria]
MYTILTRIALVIRVILQLSVGMSPVRRGCSCGVATRVDAARLRRLGDALGFCVDALHRDMRYLLDSGACESSQAKQLYI